MHHDTDDAGTRGSETRGAPVVDVTYVACVFLDALPGIFGNERTVAERQ